MSVQAWGEEGNAAMEAWGALGFGEREWRELFLFSWGKRKLKEGSFEHKKRFQKKEKTFARK